ncbi:dTDP-4-dehydrorhamnose reductase [Rubrobacter xylanophilus DSM 9941]|uniref:dTDP-4-dehydrorhamnose reductase n=1 Tax=Rubrobacter xylanophilus TaxID=49319 RepID=UPI001C6436BF|nr:dTDP-4-dehydrorhamnose reductase [Rubrobacter xylanophilus]QYJ16092.1 dTDP-4-dehydrorhamnose reductase [Rubrobacter xylanophilus DSM 9941]
MSGAARRVLVTGAGGQLGRELAVRLPEYGYEVVALGHGELDVSDTRAVGEALRRHSPEVVINAAAYTDVDGCESEAGLAYRVNALGPRNLAQLCERLGCELLHVSTNYVFDGRSERPYAPWDRPNPISVYGATKLAGEEYVRHLTSRWYIVRTAGVYGEGRNFVRTMLRAARERKTLKVKDDEHISPTYARDLAGGIIRVLEGRLYGVYHITNSGACSWHEFAREIFRIAGMDVEVVPVPSSGYPLPAARPPNGVLSSPDGPALRHWREALAEYLREELGREQHT